MTVRILIGDCRERLKEMESGSVHCCVSSPPYFGLRDYGVDGQMGLEPTPDEFVAGMVEVFREVRRVLRDDGTLWLNIGDSYTGSGKGGNPEAGKQATNRGSQSVGVLYGKTGETARQAAVTNVTRKNFDLGPKQLLGIPWRLAFALQADGWWLRQDIIWSKPNPMPESVRDRCTKAHEYLFLLSKSQRYYFDAESIAEPVAISTISRLNQDVESQAGSDRVPGKTNGAMKAVGRSSWNGSQFDKGKTAEHQLGRSQPSAKRAKTGYTADAFERPQSEQRGSKSNFGDFEKRNKRSVWEVATQPFSEAHFATFPPALIEPCVLAGCPEGGTILDPFGGAGTTGLVADRLGRNAILIELNPEYAAIAERRLTADSPLFAEVQAA